MADSFLAAMTPLGVREECVHKKPIISFPLGQEGQVSLGF